MKNKGNKTLWIVLLAVLVIIALIFLFTNFKGENNSNTEQQTKTLTLSKDNFVILDKSSFELSKETCNKGKIGDCDWAGTSPCDSRAYSVTFRLVNFPQELDSSSLTEVNHNLQIKAYSNGVETGYKNPDGTLQKITFSYSDSESTPQIILPLKYTQDNNVVFCFKINGTEYYHSYMGSSPIRNEIVSNEVCLDSFNVKALC